jgi:hypothetical protein
MEVMVRQGVRGLVLLAAFDFVQRDKFKGDGYRLGTPDTTG